MALLFVGSPPAPGRGPGERRERWLTRVSVYGGLFAAVTLVPLGARLSWLCEITTHFRVQYAAILALATGLSLLGRRWRAALVLGLFAAWNALTFLPALVTPPTFPARVGTGRLSVLSFNIYSGNRRLSAVAAYVREAAPDVLLLLEVTADGLKELALEASGFTALAVESRADNFGLALFLRRGGAATVVPGTAHIEHFGGDSVGTALAALTVDGRELSLAGVHFITPTSDRNVARRDAMLDAAARWVAGRGARGLVVGDFNATPWTPVFGEVLKTHGLRSGGTGVGLGASWPTWFPPLGIPIDHLLVGPGVTVLDRQFGPDLGSDHHPLRATVAF